MSDQTETPASTIDVRSFIAELDAEFKRLTAGRFEAPLSTRGKDPIPATNVVMLSALTATLLQTSLPFDRVVWIVEVTSRTAASVAAALKTAVEKLAYGDQGRAGEEWERNRMLQGAFVSLGDAYCTQFAQAFTNEYLNAPTERAKPDRDGLPRGYTLPCSVAGDDAAIIDMSLRLAYHFNDPERIMVIVRRFRDVPLQELGPIVVTLSSFLALRSDLTLEQFARLCELSKDLHARP